MTVQLTPQQLKVLTYTVLGEADNASTTKNPADIPASQIAVASTIKNRTVSGRFPHDPMAAALQRSQYSAWNKGTGGNIQKIMAAYPVGSAAYNRAEANVRGVFNGSFPDPTNGATHYYAPAGMKGGAAPYWWSSEAPNGGLKIGTQYFAQKTPTLASKIVAKANMVYDSVGQGEQVSSTTGQTLIPAAPASNEIQIGKHNYEVGKTYTMADGAAYKADVDPNTGKGVFTKTANTPRQETPVQLFFNSMNPSAQANLQKNEKIASGVGTTALDAANKAAGYVGSLFATPHASAFSVPLAPSTAKGAKSEVVVSPSGDAYVSTVTPYGAASPAAVPRPRVIPVDSFVPAHPKVTKLLGGTGSNLYGTNQGVVSGAEASGEGRPPVTAFPVHPSELKAQPNVDGGGVITGQAPVGPIIHPINPALQDPITGQVVTAPRTPGEVAAAANAAPVQATINAKNGYIYSGVPGAYVRVGSQDPSLTPSQLYDKANGNPNPQSAFQQAANSTASLTS